MDKDETIEAAEKLIANGSKDALTLWSETLPTAAKDPGGKSVPASNHADQYF